MKLWRQLKVWWRGIPPSITELEGGGWKLKYQNPDYPPARTRFMAAIRNPFVKRIVGVIGAIMLAVVIAAITRWLGLS